MPDSQTKRRLIKLVVRAEGQPVLEVLSPGAPLVLAVRPGAEDEAPAVLVATAEGAPLGALATADARALAEFVGTEALDEVTLHHLTGGTAQHPGHEAWIGLRWQGQEARTPVPLNAAQKAWRARGDAPAETKRGRFRRGKQADAASPGTDSGNRLVRAATAYMSGQLTWKATMIGIVISTIAMTTFLILFGAG